MISAVTIALLAVHVNLHVPVQCAHACKPRTVISFNAALKTVVPLYESRRTRVAHAVKDVKADVVCLQEVSYEEDVIDILMTLQNKYPYSWSFLHTSQFTTNEVFNALYRSRPKEKPFPCSEVGYCSFNKCANKHCSFTTGTLEFMQCVRQNCSNKLTDLTMECLACLTSSATSMDIADEKCGKAGQLTRYQGEGLLVLSKKPILSAKKIQFFPGVKQFVPRGMLEVEIFGIGKVSCTHLTADLSHYGFTYPERFLAETEGFTSYEEQQAREVTKIVERYGQTNVVLAGDLNTGPAIPSQNVTAEHLQNYETLITSGFTSPYVELDGKCTWCGENLIAHPPDNVIDHVLLRGFEATKAMRILENGTDPVSDHYGVAVTIGCE